LGFCGCCAAAGAFAVAAAINEMSPIPKLRLDLILRSSLQSEKPLVILVMMCGRHGGRPHKHQYFYALA
jgi:hypothetical protein